MLSKIDTFKAGRHRAQSGQVYEFSDADLKAIAESYDPSVSAAPIVLGHPKSDDPAWGWVKSLGIDERGHLYAEPERIDPAFAEGVEAGRYRYVSASLYAPDDERNPKAGSWYLRHLGFLGAQPPAVKGLTPAFAEEPAPAVDFSMADGFWVKDIFRSMRDFFIEKFGLDVADRVIPSWSVENVEREEPGETSETVTPNPGFSEASVEQSAELEARAAALAEGEAKLARDRAEFAEAARAASRQEDVAFVEHLVGEGRLPPVHRDQTIAILSHLAGDADVSFGEVGIDARASFKTFLGALGKSITFAEVSGGAPPVISSDPNVVAARARTLVEEAHARGETLSTAEAVARATSAFA